MDRYTIVENGYYKTLRHQLPWLVVSAVNGGLVARFNSFVHAALFVAGMNVEPVREIDWNVLP